MTDKIHRITSTIIITGLCRSTIYESVRKGTFPEPVRLGQRAIFGPFSPRLIGTGR